MIVTRGEVALHVLDFGGSGPPVLILHGPADTSREAFVEDVLTVVDHLVPDSAVTLVGQ